jgi:hypothetical protein
MTPLARAAVLLLLLGSASARAVAPPARLSAAQVERLKEWDRLWALLQKQREEGQLIGAQRTCRRAMAVERQVFGSTHGEVQGTLGVLARLCEAKGDWGEPSRRAARRRRSRGGSGARAIGRPWTRAGRPRMWSGGRG